MNHLVMSRPAVPSARRQSGFTLTELMVALVLGALVVLAATAMVVTSRATYRTQDEATRIQESARFGLELINRMVRLAGYTEFGDSTIVPAFYSNDPVWCGPGAQASIPTCIFTSGNAYSLTGPNIVGADQSKPTSGAVINGSDSLTIRYYGSGDAGVGGDGNVLDCAGFPVPAPASDPAHYSTSRAYNVLFVENDTDGEPALKCQRQTYDTAGMPNAVLDTQTLIRGVESFQVLYGEANYGVGADPDFGPPASITYRTGIGGANPVVNWLNVVTIRVAMLLRSNTGAQVDTQVATAPTFNLFGAGYNVSADAGTQFVTSTLSTPERSRIRRVVETTIFVRNRIASWPSLN